MRSVGREDALFLIRVLGEDGKVNELRARAVIDASGTWTTPNVLGADRKLFAGKHTLVAGARSGGSSCCG